MFVYIVYRAGNVIFVARGDCAEFVVCGVAVS